MDLDKLIDRMIRASKLEVDLYEEVEADPGLMNQAVLVVLLSSLAGGLGFVGRQGIRGLLFGSLAALVGWVFWAFLTYLIGTKLLPVERTEADMGEMLRTIGFSSSPGVLRIFGLIPGLVGLINFVVGIWMLVAMVIAVRQALDYESTGRAVGVCVIGWIIQAVIVGLVFTY